MKIKRDYVLDHDWGSFDDSKRIKKLLLRNVDDFLKYFYELVFDKTFVAKKVANNQLMFEDFSVFAVITQVVY